MDSSTRLQRNGLAIRQALVGLVVVGLIGVIWWRMHSAESVPE